MLSRRPITTATTAVLAVLVASPQLVQQPKAASAPAEQQPQAQAPGQPAQLRLIFSPWTKFCLKGQGANAKEVCFTGSGNGNDVRPTDPQVFVEQQKRLQEELQRRAEEARERLRRFHEQPPQEPNP
jgi:hypothetical protein